MHRERGERGAEDDPPAERRFVYIIECADRAGGVGEVFAGFFRRFANCASDILQPIHNTYSIGILDIRASSFLQTIGFCYDRI